MVSSSSLDTIYTANRARLRLITDIGSPGSGWIPNPDDHNPWLQANLAESYIIRSIVTQGCSTKMSWVEKFCLSYTNDEGTDLWYGGSSTNDCKVC